MMAHLLFRACIRSTCSSNKLVQWVGSSFSRIRARANACLLISFNVDSCSHVTVCACFVVRHIRVVTACMTIYASASSAALHYNICDQTLGRLHISRIATQSRRGDEAHSEFFPILVSVEADRQRLRTVKHACECIKPHAAEY